MGKLYLADYIVVIFYFLLMLAIGAYLSKRQDSANDYFAGGNKIPWWISGVSLYMTNFSAWIFSGAAGFIYSTGYYALIYLSISGVSFWVGSQLTAALWRRSRVMSPVEYTNTRFNNPTQVLLGISITTVFILSAGVQIAAIGKLLAAPMGISVGTIIIGIGIIVLIYTYSGGLWAVGITDFVQFVILISIAIIVLPLSIKLGGGLTHIFESLPPLTFHHTYHGLTYDEHYLVGIFIVTTVGIAAGGAQRFFCVINEKDAKKVGKLSAVLFLSFPFIFGIPPLVARVLWPDLSVIPFFQNQFQPRDLVFLGVIFKVLPIGLVGMFFAALLAATMSALSSVYNLVSAIFARDIFKDTFKPNATDKQVFLFGKLTTLVMGLIVIGLGFVFAYSTLGIFNLMVVFFTLLNIPINIPIAAGLLFKKIPKWGAFLSILWGFYAGLVIKFLLGWSFGPQIYYITVATVAILFAAEYLGKLYQTNKARLAVISLAAAVIIFLGWYIPSVSYLTTFQSILLGILSVILGSTTYFGSYLFALDTQKDKEQIANFFERLDTPVDVVGEVYAQGGGKESSTFPLVGTVTMLIGALVLLIFLAPVKNTYDITYISLSSLLILFGGSMYYFGKRSEEKSMEKIRTELKARGLMVSEQEGIVPAPGTD